ncbi:unnamed protein product [Meloidogyne enterolobii]|uniref:Uncharacterized protein n=1 Tax=Meloidogyne enterolobii TaxID=390850 RepID=A0ACB0Z032_MELEN
MLFRLLHPMDHNTGPLARKSTTLCALLLVSIAALLLLAVPGQANGEEVGVANHTKDGSSVTLELDSKLASDDLKYAEYVKRFPTVCNFLITKEHIKLLYEGKGCTVELIAKKKVEMIKFTTGYVKDGCNLECDDGEDRLKGLSNLLPFAYSKSKKDIKNYTNGPFYDGNTECDTVRCVGGKCMKDTFLEVSWRKCGGDVSAKTHLIGEVVSASSSLDQVEEEQGGDKTEFNLEIYANNSFKMLFNENMKKSLVANKINCTPKNKRAIVEPSSWEIKNGVGDLQGKHLLVFHLLPQNATRLHDEGKSMNSTRVRPKCDLFIRFNRTDDGYEFLRVDPQTTTTSTTTTTPKPTPSPKPQPTVKATQTPPEQKTTQKVQEVAATEGGSSAWIWIFVIFVVIAVIGGAVGFYFYRKNQKIKEEDEKERAFWSNFGDEKRIADENMTRSKAKIPSLEDQFVKEIFDRMKKEDEDNAAKNYNILFKCYLPDLKEKGFKTVGTYREWKKTGDTTPRDSASKKESTPKDPAQKEESAPKKEVDPKESTPKDPAPEKSDAVKSKQAGTTSDIPTDMMSEAKETDQ